MKLQRLILLCLLATSLAPLAGQNYYLGSLYESALDTISPYKLRISASGEGFFRNNEYNSAIYTGYTVPGFRASAEASYSLPALHGAQLSGGLYTLYFWGATRYPAIAFRDIGYWTDGAKDQSLHILPLLRVSIRPTTQSIVILGSIDGAQAHKLIAPVYDPELNLTADPEAGLQYRYLSPHLFVDAWVDWESFIYKRDDHQEAFTCGISSDITLASSRSPDLKSNKWRLSLPLAFVASHRGGEYNLTQTDTVHTWINAYTGLRGSYLLPSFGGTKISLSAYLLGYTQRGNHYVSDKGHGFYTQLSGSQRYVSLSVSYWYGKGWIAPHGTPFANALDAEGKLWPNQGIARYIHTQATLHYKWNKLLTAGLSSSIYFHPGRDKGTPSFFVEAYMAIRTSNH